MPNVAAGDGAARGGKAGGGKGGASSNGGKGGGGRPRQGDWACFLCGFQSNRDFRGRCWSCEALRSASMEQAFGAYAQRQVQQQRQAQQQQQRSSKKGNGSAGGPPSSAECKELREKVDKLQSELAATKALAARGNAAEVEDEDEAMDEADGCDFTTWTEDERAKRLELARGGLAYATACHGEESQQAVELRSEIAALQKASREAKPFKAHRNQLERRRDDLRRKQERDESAIGKTKTEIEELQAKLGTLKAAVEERAKAIACVTEELNQLVLKTLAEEGNGAGDDKKATGSQVESPWAALSAALHGLAGLPGLPAEVAALLTQVQHVANSCTAAAAAADTPQRTTTLGTTDDEHLSTGGVAAGGQPSSLAPQWRRGKAAAKSSPPHQRPQPPDPLAAAAVSTANAAAAAGGNIQQGGGGKGDDGAATGAGPATTPADGGTAAAAAAAVAAAAVAASAGAAGAAEGGSDEELVEAADGDAMQVEIEESIAKLPDRDQRRLRAALRKGGVGGQAAGGREDGEGTESRRQERERSPRPTKTSDADA